MVGAEEVVVNGLGYAHHTAFIPDRLHIAADLVAGIHRIISAVIEEVAYIIFFEYFKNPLVIGIINFGVFDLIAAGAELRRRRVEQVTEFFRILFIHHKQLVIQHTDNTVRCTVYLGDFLRFKSGLDNAVRTGVDNRSRTAGLTENTGTN